MHQEIRQAVETCPKCNSTHIARDLRFYLDGADNGALRVGKQIARKKETGFWTLKPNYPEFVVLKVKPEVCTDCGHVELIAEGELRDSLQMSASDERRSPVAQTLQAGAILEIVFIVVAICLGLYQRFF